MSSWGPALAGVACSAHGELPPQASFELLLTAAANRSGAFVADEAACKQRCPSFAGSFVVLQKNVIKSRKKREIYLQ